MGFGDVVSSIGDTLKGITPDLSTAKRAGGAAYNCTSAAFTKIDQVVRVEGIQKLPQYLPDGETRAQIGLFTTILAKNTGKYIVYEGFKHIPGAMVANKLISDTMLQMKRENQKDEMKAIKAKMVRLEERLKKSTSQSQNLNLSSHNAGGGGTGDMINMFKKMFRDLMVPKLSRMEKSNND